MTTKPVESLHFEEVLPPDEAAVYARWLNLMNRSGVPYAVGGALALHLYTGLWRDTKDLDVFIKPEDLRAVLDTMGAAGYAGEVTDGRWLAKVRSRPYEMDLIFGRSPLLRDPRVDDRLLERSREARLLGIPARVMGPEALIATKAHIAKHYRFDGADIAHLVYRLEGNLDWRHLTEDLDVHPSLLLWHLIFFSFIYPGQASRIPGPTLHALFQRLGQDATETDGFRGLLLDPESFEDDCRLWGQCRPDEEKPLVNPMGDAV